MSKLYPFETDRRNAQDSAGPHSLEGKAAPGGSTLKSGINAQAQVIPGEDPAELEALTDGYHQQFQPASPLANFLVDALVYADWQLRRLRRAEAQLWHSEIEDARKSRAFPLKDHAALGDVFGRGRNSFIILQRRIDSTERSYYRALQQLQRLEAGVRPAGRSRRPPAPGPQPVEKTPPSPNSASFRTVLAPPAQGPGAPPQSPAEEEFEPDPQISPVPKIQ